MLKGHGRYGVTASSQTPVLRGRDTRGGGSRNRHISVAALSDPGTKKGRTAETAAGSSTYGQQGGGMSLRSTMGNYSAGAMEGILPKTRRERIEICRDIYEFDSVSGAAVDLMSNLPFSGFTLSGINDRKILGTFVKSIESLRMPNLFPYLGRDFLTDGAFVATPEMDNSGVFTRMITHDNMRLEVKPIPIYGFDPLVTLNISPEVAELFSGKNKNPYLNKIKEQLPDFLKKGIAGNGSMDLDPDSTLYVARKSFTYDSLGMSYLHRIIPLWLMEKAFLRGSIEQSYQRQRAITHAVAGNEEWEPTDSELSEIVGLLVSANMDPTGAVIATRPDININEIIRGDDFYKHCLAEGTLIQTEHGLVPIEELSYINNSPVKVMGGKGAAKAIKWHKTGKKKVFDYTLKDGQTVRSTRFHQFMVLDENHDLVWKRGYELQVGDRLCVSTKKLVAKKPFKIENFEPSVYGNEGRLTVPTHMNPQLAYALGLFVSEGWANKYTVQFGNSDPKLLKKFENIMRAQFGLNPSRTMVPAGNDSGGMTSTKDFFDLKYCRKQLSEFFEFLGAQRVTAKHKVVPHSILQSDEASQLAYLAGYIEGDGWIRDTNIGVTSSSVQNLRQTQAMAAALGYQGHIHNNTLTFNREASFRLRSAIGPYLVSKIQKVQSPVYASSGGGVPTSLLKDEISARRQPLRKQGVVMACDDGSEIEVRGFARLFGNLRSEWSTKAFQEGDYNEQLDIIHAMSPDLHEKIMDLFGRDFRFVELETVTEVGMVETYDLTMDAKAENSFVAEGVVVHNSDVYDYLAQAKMRALNISDSFLSGDATFTTMEVALSVFMEQLRQYRETITREVFYEKLFPAIALANGFKKSARDLKATGAFSTSIREVGVGKERKLIAVCDGSSLHEIKNIQDITEYHIPKVDWHKQLAPQADRDYLDLLASMREQGIPIPVRMMAAAAGLNLDQIMGMLEDDMETRETLADHLKQVNKLLGQEEGGEFASLMGHPMARRVPKRRMQALANDQEMYGVRVENKNGKRKYVRPEYQKTLEERADRVMAEALARIANGQVDPRKIGRRWMRKNNVRETISGALA